MGQGGYYCHFAAKGPQGALAAVWGWGGGGRTGAGVSGRGREAIKASPVLCLPKAAVSGGDLYCP